MTTYNVLYICEVQKKSFFVSSKRVYFKNYSIMLNNKINYKTKVYSCTFILMCVAY